MRRTLLFTLFTFVVFSLIFGGTGTLRIGPFSLRHICSFGLLIYILGWVGKKRITFSPAFKYYLLYLLIYVTTNIVNGEITTHHFVQSLYTYHLPCFLILLSFPLMIKDRPQLSLMTTAIVFLYLFNAVITIFQFKGDPLAWEIGRSLADLSEEKIEQLDYINTTSNSLFGYSLASGIIGFAVTNGYILASYCPLLTKNIYGDKNIKWLVDLTLIIVAIVAAFVVQQRTAFFLILLYLVFLVFVRSNSVFRFLILLLFPLSLFAVGDTSINLGSLGRIQDFSSGIDTRQLLLSNFEDFLNSNYMWFGGYNAYTQNFGMGQHNALLSAWVLGGLFSFICFLTFFVYLLCFIISTVKRAIKDTSSHIYTIIYGASSLIYLLYSLMHSDGVQNGSPMFWIVFTLFLISQTIEKNNNTNEHIQTCN